MPERPHQGISSLGRRPPGDNGRTDHLSLFLNSINGERKHNIAVILRDWLPFLCVCFIYENLHDLSGLVQKPDIAPMLMKMDIAIFGFEPTVWAQKIHHPVLTDIMAVSYALISSFHSSSCSSSPRKSPFRVPQDGARSDFRLSARLCRICSFSGSPPRYLIQDLFTDPVRFKRLFYIQPPAGHVGRFFGDKLRRLPQPTCRDLCGSAPLRMEVPQLFTPV
jgi:hypothetical protein